jgi:hypothetical protein
MVTSGFRGWNGYAEGMDMYLIELGMRDGEACVANRAESRDPHLPSRCGRVAMRGLCAVETQR